MRLFFLRISRAKTFRVIAGLVLVGFVYSLSFSASGAVLGPRSMTMSSSVAGAPATYKFDFDLSTAGPLGSIVLQYCNNTPEVNDPCTPPAGQSVAGVSLIDQSGATGFSIGAGTNDNTIVISRAVTPSVVGPVSFTFTDAINPASNGTYFTRIQTYATTDGSGPASDYGSIALAINNRVSITAEVPPFLNFCAALTIPTLNCDSATGDYINFGELSSVRPSVGTSEILSATNAKDGFNVTVAGTTMTSGNNEIARIITRDVSRPGTAQFGFNLRSNSSPRSGEEPRGPGLGGPTANYALANFYQFNSGDVVITYPEPDDVRHYSVSYVVNVPALQAPGVYVSTVTYICLGNF